MAILARTVAYANCKPLGPRKGNVTGIDDSDKQNYNPQKIEEFANKLAVYQQAIDETAGIYLTYNGNIFDVQYKDISNRWTNGDTAPHLSIFDLAGQEHTTEQYKTGVPQKNANHWANGEAHGRVLPPANYCQQLAHYLTGVNFACTHTQNPVPLDYRFHFGYLHNLSDQRANPVIWRRGQFITLNTILQNVGNTPWVLTPSVNSPLAVPVTLYRWVNLHPLYLPVLLKRRLISR
jgi:hypothetical protein